MTTPTKTQAELLLAIANAKQGAAQPEAPAKTIAAMVKHGWLISLPRIDGPSQLLITNAGRAAIGEPPAPTAQPAPAPGPQRADSGAAKPPKGKLGLLVALLSNEQGATVEAMTAATGWQAHSVRGAMSGALKKGMGLAIASEKTDAGRRYRIVAEKGA